MDKPFEIWKPGMNDDEIKKLLQMVNEHFEKMKPNLVNKPSGGITTIDAMLKKLAEEAEASSTEKKFILKQVEDLFNQIEQLEKEIDILEDKLPSITDKEEEKTQQEEILNKKQKIQELFDKLDKIDKKNIDDTVVDNK